MDNKFIRVRSVKDIVILASLIIAGSVLVAMPTSIPVNITGFFMIFTGIILLLVMKTGYKDVETGEKYQKKELYFQQAVRAQLMSAISEKPNYIDLYEEDKGNALKLDFYYSKSAGKAYLQLFEYIPHTYEPCSKVYEYGLKDVDKLLA